jgi:hypothetical protein
MLVVEAMSLTPDLLVRKVSHMVMILKEEVQVINPILNPQSLML